jgi:hypothetical protein
VSGFLHETHAGNLYTFERAKKVDLTASAVFAHQGGNGKIVAASRWKFALT